VETVIDAQTYSRLQDIIRREGRSLLQYAAESFPWTVTAADVRPAVLGQAAQDEAEAAAAVARLLVRHRLTPPWLGAYPMAFTSFNFLAIDRLLPLLVQHQIRGVEELKADVAALEDEEARDAVRGLLNVKQENLKKFEGLLLPGAEPAASPA
jgi:hypothetical protein